jgi:hypothetical protein
MSRESRSTDHPYHDEEYDEVQAWHYNRLPLSGKNMLIEERKALDSNNDVQAFSLILLYSSSPGSGFLPFVEIQHEPRRKYPNSINLIKDGTILWDLDNNFRRLKDFECDHKPDFRQTNNIECYEKLINKELDKIIEDLFLHHPRFRSND